MERRFILLGASRGLGWATYQALREKFSDGRFLLSSRKIEARAKEVSDQTILFPHDFSVTPVNLVFLARLQEFDPTDLIYFAGGGPTEISRGRNGVITGGPSTPHFCIPQNCSTTSTPYQRVGLRCRTSC